MMKEDDRIPISAADGEYYTLTVGVTNKGYELQIAGIDKETLIKHFKSKKALLKEIERLIEILEQAYAGRRYI